MTDNLCEIAGPYLPVGDTDWMCRTHRVEAEPTDDGWQCPVSGQVRPPREKEAAPLNLDAVRGRRNRAIECLSPRNIGYGAVTLRKSIRDVLPLIAEVERLRALLTAEPTEAEVERAARAIWRWFVGDSLDGFDKYTYAYDREKCMDAARAALRAARGLS